MRKMVYEINYDWLIKLGVVFDDGVVLNYFCRSEVVSFMDWVVEWLLVLDGVLGNEYCIVVLLGYYFEQNGDLCKDLEMVVLIYFVQKMVEVFIFEMLILLIYQQVFLELGKVVFILQKELNSFLC